MGTPAVQSVHEPVHRFLPRTALCRKYNRAAWNSLVGKLPRAAYACACRATQNRSHQTTRRAASRSGLAAAAVPRLVTKQNCRRGRARLVTKRTCRRGRAPYQVKMRNSSRSRARRQHHELHPPSKDADFQRRPHHEADPPSRPRAPQQVFMRICSRGRAHAASRSGLSATAARTESRIELPSLVVPAVRATRRSCSWGLASCAAARSRLEVAAARTAPQQEADFQPRPRAHRHLRRAGCTRAGWKA